MVFASLEFLTLFLPAFLALYVASPARWRNGTLLVCSWFFYGWWSPVFLLLFIGLTVWGWLGGIVIDAASGRRARGAWLGVFIAVNVLILCWFKYANIVVDSLDNALALGHAGPIPWRHVALPIGLSFIVLQSISYLIDVQRGTVTADRSVIRYGAYQGMFVHLIAGPIIRYAWVKRELVSRTVDWDGVSAGARRLMVGMSMKVLVADTLSPMVDAIFSLHTPSLADAWLGCGFYTLQLFFDFAGYSAMAIGLGQMLGFRFPENFNHPYLASSIQDFWRRWHLSLSSWIRDYLYIPLGGNRHGEWKAARNLLLTMAIAGLWHGGDSWNFLLWGVAHGLALMVARLWRRFDLPRVPGWLSHALTLVFVMLAWTLFRAVGFHAALAMYRGQFGLNGIGLSDAVAVSLRPVHALAALLGVVCVLLPIGQRRWERLPDTTLRRIWDALWPLAGFLLSFGLIAARGAVPFLYFQF
ncbi:MBOAT family O-acyltransferase [Paraburkholderia sp. BCC1886]|uniref:MBOAT family O-acyltransferase n=1 Tax=Paraburkholderia sp. BCC1886 TaxID=2562670 RepID=UPI00118275A7|nr:MBOAT family protein [Paraburkholderia sp. BCC1886]